MDEPRKKRSILSGLFRRRSDAQRNGKLQKQSSFRDGERDDSLPLRWPKPDLAQISGARRRPRRPDPRGSKGKDREEFGGGGGFYEQAPLTEWPPSGVSSEEELTLDHAVGLISRGVPHFKGHKRPIPHASDQYYGLYSTTTGDYGDDDDAADLHYAMTQLMTLRMQGSSSPVYPWETLEQPSMAFGFGRRPGTISLNRWVGLSSAIPASIPLRDLGTGMRDVTLVHIFERLKELEAGLREDDEDQKYRLYKRFLKDPDKVFNPHKSMERQIMDLVTALSSEDWIDFTNPRNQVITKFIYDTGGGSRESHGQYFKFFYQLLLSLELDLRINSRIHDEWAKERLVGLIPPRIQWNLALARRWRHNIRIEEWGPTPDQVRLKFKLRKRQTKVLKRFAKLMKWPNLDATLDALRRRDAEGSSVTPTFPFLMMNALIDIDPDRATDDLALLTHLQPHCGFQHRNSYTYWTSSCIVGKVLAPTCREVAGWVGPALPTFDLGRSQIARIRARKPRLLITPEDVASMSERSDPLGPPAEVYPVKEYVLLPGAPDPDDWDRGRGGAADTIRIEQINLTDAKMATNITHNNNSYSNNPNTNNSNNPNNSNEPLPPPGAGAGGTGGGPPKVFDASILFAIDGASWPLNLQYDVSFVCAWPCSDGPHPLFFDYAYTAVRADEVVRVRNWGKPGASIVEPPGSASGSGGSGSGSGARGGGKKYQNLTGGVPKSSKQTRNGLGDDGIGTDGEDAERVLVVEAYGVSDNEVLARAWCAHWGLSAVVADVRRTCMACAIREAYAATLTVVILVDDHQRQQYSGSE
ncbi:hypothetical protein SLS62_010758 [Diatrype stigma]|uniref:VTC domain-containing protein n=1 Tax=Diatrype stigma TaxID=117547 RepID=A0AAN9YHH2_9PEZI